MNDASTKIKSTDVFINYNHYKFTLGIPINTISMSGNDHIPYIVYDKFYYMYLMYFCMDGDIKYYNTLGNVKAYYI